MQHSEIGKDYISKKNHSLLRSQRALSIKTRIFSETDCLQVYAANRLSRTNPDEALAKSGKAIFHKKHTLCYAVSEYYLLKQGFSVRPAVCKFTQQAGLVELIPMQHSEIVERIYFLYRIQKNRQTLIVINSLPDFQNNCKKINQF
jgi:hypothetical protein